jgi:hypothetical protein
MLYNLEDAGMISMDFNHDEKTIITESQVNPVDEEDFLWRFLQDWEEFKKDNIGKRINGKTLFKNYCQKVRSSQIGEPAN